jgi:hypothetical protein
VPLRRQSSEILYPFTPAAETHRDLLSGIVDAFFIVKGVADSFPDNSSSSSMSSDEGIDKYSTFLYKVTVTAGSNTYVFYSEAPDNYWKKFTFEVPRGSGIVKVTANEDPLSFIVANSDLINSTIAVTSGLNLPLEPSRTVWQIEEVRSIRLVNEYRDPATATRAASIAANPDETVLYLADTTNTLELLDGYNCSLNYNESTKTLTINGGAGLGKGLPEDFPWDTDAIDIYTGIKSINSINIDGNVEIQFGESIIPEYSTNSITMNVREDTD